MPVQLPRTDVFAGAAVFVARIWALTGPEPGAPNVKYFEVGDLMCFSAVQDERLKERLKANEQRLNNLDIEDLDAGTDTSWTAFSGCSSEYQRF